MPAGELQPAILLPPRPNPAVGQVRLRFMPPKTDDLRLAICDIAGRRIRCLPQGSINSGIREVCWDGRDELGRAAPTGVYFVHATSGGRSESARFVLLQSQPW